MKKKKKWIGIIALTMCFLIAFGAVWFGVQQGQEPPITTIPDEDVPLGGSQGTLIKENDYDKNIIPDKYNCGATGKLKKVKLGDTVKNIKLKISGNNNIIDLAYSNKKVSGTVTIKNMDFSDNQLLVYNEGKVDRNIKLKFVNCKFSKVVSGYKKTKISYSFSNCTFNSFSGSNSSFDKCLFGGYFTDGVVPYQNVTVKNSYFKDMAVENPSGKGVHTDGTQIYGNKEAIVKDILFDNCRFEIPAIETSSVSAKVNACLMVQLEYNDANNIRFTDCKINGGGYSIYAWDKDKGLKLDNVTFENIDVGCARIFDSIYPKVASTVTFDNVKDTSSLYVSSVWKSDKKTHVVVTNDTDKERTLIICTNKGVYTKTIKACPKGYKNQQGLYKSFKEFPFDVDVSIPVDAKYVVCYEVIDKQLVQLRFVNWTKKNVRVDEKAVLKKYVSKGTITETTQTSSAVTQENDPQITVESLQGECGADVSFELNKHILVVKGTGATWDYSSTKTAPWYEAKDQITEIVVEEGVTIIGNQLFTQCSNLTTVTLPDSLTVIKDNAFMKSKNLTDVKIPANVTTIGRYCFEGTGLQRALIEGGESQWNEMSIGTNNDKLLAAKCYE